MGAILFAMGCMSRKLRRDGVLNVARKVPLVLLKDGKGGQEVFIWDWEGEKGKATIMLMWPSSQRMDWKPLIWTYGDPAAHSYSSSPCCVQHVCNFFRESKLSPWLHAMHAILI